MHSAGLHYPLLSKRLIQLSAYTWQPSLTSAAAEQLPAGPGVLPELLVRSWDDISLLELGNVAAYCPWGWVVEGWRVVACCCVYAGSMESPLCLNTVLHRGRAASKESPCTFLLVVPDVAGGVMGGGIDATFILTVLYPSSNH